MDASQPSPSVSPAGDSNDTYNVIVRGERFQLSRNQIDFDAPNFFSAYFSSGFVESAKRTLTLDHNPALFALIIEYLSGYPILPLSAESAPPLMSLAMARRCLLADAQFYGLQKLSTLLTTSTLNLETRWMGYATQTIDLRDLVRHTLPTGIIQQPDGSVVSPQTGLSIVAFAHNVAVTYVHSCDACHSCIDCLYYPRFICTRRVSAERPDEVDVAARALMVKIAYPSGSFSNIHLSLPVRISNTAASMISNEDARHRIAQRDLYWGMAGGWPVQESGIFNIDGMNDSLDSIFTGMSCNLPAYPRDENLRHYDLGTRIWRTASQQGGELEHRSFAFWADELLCRVIPRAQSNSPVDADAWVEIVKANLRTRQHFLENLHVESLDQGECSNASHRFAIRIPLTTRFRWPYRLNLHGPVRSVR